MYKTSNFVDIVDRYLEVSNVYHQRILDSLNKDEESQQVSDRFNRLLKLLEDVNIGRGSIGIKTIKPEDSKGRSVLPTKDFLNQTERYQKTVLDRLQNKSTALPTPRNLGKLYEVLKLTPDQYLGCFPTPGYAWDILTELASLSVLPDSKILVARDMIHMHAVELQIHLAKVTTQVRLSTPEYKVKLNGSFSVEELISLQDSNHLVEKLIEFSVPRDSDELMEELISIVSEMPKIDSILGEDQQLQILSCLKQEYRAFPDTLKKSYSLKEAQVICDNLVIFGLNAAYTAWYTLAQLQAIEEGSLRKNMLFCTRILLDEGRWYVCRSVAKAALIISEELKKLPDRELQGTAMIKTNLFFSRVMCGEKIEDEIKAWDTSELDNRYKFLQQILLKNFGDAARLATNLLQKNTEDGSSKLCINEILEWPILADFRISTQGKEVINNFI